MNLVLVGTVSSRLDACDSWQPLSTLTFPRVEHCADFDAVEALLAGGACAAVVIDAEALPHPRSESCARLASLCATEPLVVLVGSSSIEVAPELLEAGADDVVEAEGASASVLAIALLKGKSTRALRLAMRADLAAATRRLENLERDTRERQAYYQQVAHDLRTPLTVIVGSCDLLRERRAISTCTQLIVKNARKLLLMVEDLERDERVPSGTAYAIRPTAFNLRKELESTLSPMVDEAKARGLHFDLSLAAGLPKRVETDALRLHQILTNLVGNALKFTTRGHVKVHVASVAGTGPRGRLTIDVADTGSGIDPSYHERVFQPYERACHESEREGRGLGLTVARQLARRLGGDVVLLSSMPGSGSVFRATLSVMALTTY